MAVSKYAPATDVDKSPKLDVEDDHVHHVAQSGGLVHNGSKVGGQRHGTACSKQWHTALPSPLRWGTPRSLEKDET